MFGHPPPQRRYITLEAVVIQYGAQQGAGSRMHKDTITSLVQRLKPMLVQPGIESEAHWIKIPCTAECLDMLSAADIKHPNNSLNNAGWIKWTLCTN